MAPRALAAHGFGSASLALLLFSLLDRGDAVVVRASSGPADKVSFLGREGGSLSRQTRGDRQIPPAPAPALSPAPGPAVLPPCNFTYDADGVAWPADCREIPNDPQKRITCMAMVGGMFNNPYCAPPPLYPCGAFPPAKPEEVGKPPVLNVYGFGQAHGSTRIITCMPHAVPIDGKYEVSSWGEAWYKGAKSTTAICNNGTWAKVDPYGGGGYLKPIGFACATRGQLKALRDMKFDEDQTRVNLASAEDSHAVWLDKAANERKVKLREAQQAAADLYNQALQQNIAPERTLKTVDGSVRDSHMGPAKGVKMTDFICQDFQKHFPMEPTESIKHPFVCRYAMQKTPLGVDPITAQSTYLYRDGCFCESRWKGLCPFSADQTPMYKDFGFHSLDERPVTDGMGGPPSGALCWYWSDNLHPEYGYTSDTIGAALAAAEAEKAAKASNSTGNSTSNSTAPFPAQGAAPVNNSLMTSPQADASAAKALAQGL